MIIEARDITFTEAFKNLNKRRLLIFRLKIEYQL